MKKLIFTTKKSCAVESFCLRSLSTDETDILILSKLLQFAKDSTNFEELLREFNGNEAYVPLVRRMISSGVMTKELYWKVYEMYGSNAEIRECLLGTIYTDNVIPKDLYEQIKAA